jgi:hypothetical protein
VVAEVKGLFAQPPLTGSPLAVDQTGSGRGGPVTGGRRRRAVAPADHHRRRGAGRRLGGEKKLVGAIQVPL